MRVLFVTCHLPYPTFSGGRMREHELLRRIGRRHDVHVVAVSKTYDDDVRNAPRLERLGLRVTVVPAGTQPCDADDRPEQVRRHASVEARAVLTELAATVDLVHVEGFYLFDLLPRPCPAPVLLGEQNVECDLWAQRAAVAVDEVARRRAEAERARTRAAEIAAWQAADLVAVVTDDDREVMRAIDPGLDVVVVPDGVSRAEHALLGEPAPRPTVVFVGNFAYEPNVDAARWLCRDIVPLLREHVPGVHVQLVGNAPPDDVLGLACDDVDVTGRVPSVDPFLSAAHVVVCPLRIGGGVKVKMLEAMARGKAVVATSVAAQGLGAVRDAFVVADDAGGIADQVARLLEGPADRRALELAAAGATARLPSWDDAASALAAAYRALADEEAGAVAEQLPA